MSSKACRTVLFPEPESPVRMTSCRGSGRFCGYFLDHHGLQRVLAVIEEFALARDDRLADTQDGVLALLDVLHQLHGSRESFLYVVAHVTVGGIFDQQTPVRWT